MKRRQFTSELPDLSGVITWLALRDVPAATIADILSMPIGSVGVSLHRSRHGGNRKRERAFLELLDNRLKSTDLSAFPKAIRFRIKPNTQRNIIKIENDVDRYAETSWIGIPFLMGTSELGSLLGRVSEPASDNLPLLRVQARLYLLEAQAHLHAGYAFTALRFGLDAHGLWEWIFRTSGNALDLEQLATTVLHISNACISRRDVSRATKWLDLAGQAFAAANSQRLRWPDPEMLRQRASIARGLGDLDEARKKLKAARESLPYTVPDATQAQLDSMADRVLNVIADTPKWEASRRLLENALDSSTPTDQRGVASNLLWTVSGGLQTDSDEVHREAMALLSKYRESTGGLGLQTTGAYLLSLTPRVPKRLRKAWAMFAISYNAYSGK